MKNNNLLLISIFCVVLSLLNSGCVERKLTIITEPQEAMVTLNDEQIGESPVTVSFEWYGDYYVRISKDGYKTLDTHQMIKGPWYDHFPFDFFAEIVYPGRIIDSYKFTFVLEEQEAMTREGLIDKAQQMQDQL